MFTSSSQATHQARALSLDEREDDAIIRIEEVASFALLESLRSEWEGLWARSPYATPFQLPQWLLTWWRHIGDGRLLTFAIRSAADELVGLAPLYVHVDQGTGQRHVFPIGIATTDYLDILAKPGWTKRVIRCVFAELASVPTIGTCCEFPQLRRDAALLRVMPPPGCAEGHHRRRAEPGTLFAAPTDERCAGHPAIHGAEHPDVPQPRCARGDSEIRDNRHADDSRVPGCARQLACATLDRARIERRVARCVCCSLAS